MRRSNATGDMGSPPSRRRLRPSGGSRGQLHRDVSISIISCSSRESLGNYSMASCSSTESLQDKSWVQKLGKQIFSKQKSPRGTRIRKGKGIRREPKQNSVAPGRVAPFQPNQEFGRDTVLNWWNTGDNLQDESVASLASVDELEGGTRIGIQPQMSDASRGSSRQGRSQWDMAPQSQDRQEEADEPERRPRSRENTERKKREDAMNLISGYFEREAPVVEQVKAVCSERKMERRRIERERQEEKRRRQVELRKAKAENKKKRAIEEEQQRVREEEEEKQRKLEEARYYLTQAKEKQQLAKVAAKIQWQQDYNKEQEILKGAFVRAQRKQLEKDKEKFGARPVTAGGSIVAEAESQQRHEKAAEWWAGGESGRRAQSAPTTQLPLTSADSDYGSDVDRTLSGMDSDSGSDVELEQRQQAKLQLAAVLGPGDQAQQEEQQQQQNGLISPSRPAGSASTMSQQTPRGTVGMNILATGKSSAVNNTSSSAENQDRPITPRSRPPPRGTRGSRPCTPQSQNAPSHTPPACMSGLDRPTSAGRRMVPAAQTSRAGSVAAAAAAAQVSRGLAPQNPTVGQIPTVLRTRPSTADADAARVAEAEAKAAAAVLAAAEKVQEANQAQQEAQERAAALEKAQKEANERAAALEHQVQHLLSQQHAQSEMEKKFQQREQAMAAQIQDLRDKLKETVEL